jgi:hypothetical protein
MNKQLPKPGQRVECISMADAHRVPVGVRGTVTAIFPWNVDRREYNIYVAWDNGSTLALLTDTDTWKVLSNEG